MRPEGEIRISEGGSTRTPGTPSFDDVKVGDELERGDPIGVEGNVGQFDMSTHLHLEAMKPGTPACTLPWERDDKGDLYNVDPEPILKEKGAL